MKMWCTSSCTGQTYCPEDSIKLVNPKQVLFYICKGITIQDVFTSQKYQNGEKTLVFTVDKKASQEAYIEWQNTPKIDKTILDGCEFPALGPDEVKILNLKQVIFYLQHDADLIRMLPIVDRITEDPVLAFVFNKEETADIYASWKKIKAGLR